MAKEEQHIFQQAGKIVDGTAARTLGEAVDQRKRQGVAALAPKPA